MKGYERPFPQFSLCGLNCGLCPMHIGNYCPGCGGGAGHQPCAFIRCSRTHGDVEYCSQCADFPCPRFAEAQLYDSFLPHGNMTRDLERAKAIGMPAYGQELAKKRKALDVLLARYNDGQRKSFFATAVNLLPLEDIETVLAQLAAQAAPGAEQKERAAAAARLLQAVTMERGIVLKLRKKPKE